MKYAKIGLLTVALCMFSIAASAQHGNGAAAGGGVGHGSNGASDNAHGANAHSGSTHGMTTDQILSKNTQLSDKIQSLTGMPAQQACTGFKNVGQCVAAAHVSKNLGISFACMQSNMTGQAPAQGTSCPTGTGMKTMSLGKSIRALDPAVNAKVESKKARKQAHADVNASAVQS